MYTVNTANTPPPYIKILAFHFWHNSMKITINTTPL